MRELKQQPSIENDKVVPFFNYPEIYRQHREEYVEVLDDVLSRGAYIMQKDLSEFEDNLQNYLGVKHAIGTADGTMALLMSLLALDIKPGDEVIVPTHTFVASASAIHHSGGIPVIVDCGSDHLVTAEAIEGAVTKKTKAIMPVQLNGRVADMDSIMEIAETNNLLVVEDACQALGAKYKNKFAGTFGVAGAFSFYPSKTLGAFGDAGAVVTNDDVLAEKIRLLRDHGRSESAVVTWGFNARMDNIHAAILNKKFVRYSKEITKRRELALLYDRELRNMPQMKLPPPPLDDDDHFDIFQNYEVEAESRDELMVFLKARGVHTIKQWGGSLLHQFDKLNDKIVKEIDYAENMVRNYLLLPMNTSLSTSDVRHVCNMIHAFYS